jgi:hypothetical protein
MTFAQVLRREMVVHILWSYRKLVEEKDVFGPRIVPELAEARAARIAL